VGSPVLGRRVGHVHVVQPNKRSIALDLKRDGGLEVVRRLVQRADVFVQSLHAGAADAMGLGFDGAVALNPRIVYCSVTAFGTRGPLRDYPGYDALMQATAGSCP
jgi:formyl-CoA transferase